jgi:hypothetical protein
MADSPVTPPVISKFDAFDVIIERLAVRRARSVHLG